MSRRVGLVAALAAAACCSGDHPSGPRSKAQTSSSASFTVFATAEIRGQIGPCGCTSDPLGDLSRTAKLVSDARAAGPVLVLDAGSLLYSKFPVPPMMAAEEELKADLLASTFRDTLHVAAIGLGPADLATGPGALRLPRQSIDARDAKLAIEAPKVVEIAGAKVGVFGVVAAGAVPGLAIDDPVATSKAAIGQLKQQGAQIVIALVQAGSKKDAVKLVHDIGGIDLAIAGLGANAPEPELVAAEPQKIGTSWLVIPGNRGQVVSKLELTVRGAGPLTDAIGRAAAAARIAAIDKQLVGLDADLARFAADKDADPTFVANKHSERAALAAERELLQAQPLVAPAAGNYFTLDQVRINKLLACSVPVQNAIAAYDLAAGHANFKAAENQAVPSPPKGQASYVGTEACGDCHSDAVDFWKTTVHANAWKTLEERGQQFDYACIGCHVTGWDKPGGTNLAHTDKLRDVQCETCHGPGSIHVAKGGEDKPFSVQRAPAEGLCASQCHTKEHSDTFQHDAYLRDVIGPGHGASKRKLLGDGPTGHELRKAALDKAGRTLGTGCIR